MEVKDILKKLTREDVKHILVDMYGVDFIHDRDGNIIFEAICCASQKHKLYYYDTSKEEIGKFHCYRCGTHGNIIDLIEHLSGTPFSENIKTIAKYIGVSISSRRNKRGFTRIEEENRDLEFLNIHNRKKHEIRRVETDYDDGVLEWFSEEYPLCWQEEGIDGYSAEKYNFRFDHNRNRAIIPVRGIEGNLIGIRVRNFETTTVERGFKYMPLDFQGLSYRFPTSTTLYGLYENQNTIRRKRKAIIFEAEKSVGIIDTFYQGECFALATYGTNFSAYHRDVLIELGVTEITFAWDKEYCEEYYDEKYDGTKEQNLMFAYFNKLKKACKLLHSYMTVNLLIDFDSKLDMKDAPCDKGKQTFEYLMKNKVTIVDVDEDFKELFHV